MPTAHQHAAKKGRLSLSIDQDILDRLEPFKHQINLSAQAERLFVNMIEELENRDWAQRNAKALVAHGEDIASSGLAGTEFERI